MSAHTIISLILIGLTGRVGVCGGIIIVPSLIYFLGISQKSRCRYTTQQSKRQVLLLNNIMS